MSEMFQPRGLWREREKERKREGDEIKEIVHISIRKSEDNVLDLPSSPHTLLSFSSSFFFSTHSSIHTHAGARVRRFSTHKNKLFNPSSGLGIFFSELKPNTEIAGSQPSFT